MAPPVSAQKPCIGVSLVILRPMGRTMREPPISVPSAIEAWQASTPQYGTENALPGCPPRREQHGDDAHGLLRVVAAMTEGIERSRAAAWARPRPEWPLTKLS